MIKSPRVTVLMPVYNGERYLREAVNSILSQTFEDFEFIVVDDGSTDATPEILAGYRDPRLVRVRFESNRGVVHALNRGLEVAKGEFLARQDADDVSLPERLREQVALLTANREIVLVGSAYWTIDESGVQLKAYHPPTTDTGIRWQMLFHNAFAATAVMLRMDLIRRQGLRYDPELAPSEDYGLWSRMLKLGRAANLGKALVKYRVHRLQASRIGEDRQRANANRVSGDNLQALSIVVDETSLRVLRDFAIGFPRSMTAGEMLTYERLFDVLSQFEKQAGIDPVETGRLRRQSVWHTLSRIRVREWGSLYRSGLLRRLLREDGPTAVIALATRIPSRAAYRIARTFSS